MWHATLRVARVDPGAPKGRPGGAHKGVYGSTRGAIFVQKSQKIAPRCPKGAKSPEKGYLKIDAKMDAEKEAKNMRKGFQNDAQMDAKIIDFFIFLCVGVFLEIIVFP